MNRSASATLIILDGARPDVFRHLVEEGRLPNVSRYLLEEGAIVPATTVFPSTTGVAYLPFLTGCFPGTLDVPGIRWLDPALYRGRWFRDRMHVRSYCGWQAGWLNRDIRPEIATLFDLEPDAAALCTPFTRGLGTGGERMRRRRGILGSQAHYTGYYEILDRAVGRELAKVAALGKRLVFAVFPGVDGITHWYDPWHPRVLDLYLEFDRALGRYVEALKTKEEHLIVLASDHGATRISLHSDVSSALERFGLRTLRHPIVWRRSPEAAVMVSGNAAAHLYFAPGVPRSRRWTVAEIEGGTIPSVPGEVLGYLANLPGVALIAGSDGEGGITLVSRKGRSRIQETDRGTFIYSPESGDVLALGSKKREYTPHEWLAESFHSPYPDAVVQLGTLFRSRRTGDLVVAADAQSDLRDAWEIPEHRSGHGSLVAEHMHCLLAVNRKIAGPIRTVDVFSLLLQHLGYPIPAGIDGQLPVKRSAGAKRVLTATPAATGE
ncbi:MAG: hypothetical protein KatS3mg081_2083 [Gemmatimonadales bacterium]|nr:hypothetical protein HRbin33_01147 [bacterium HR33]GIW52728.1 MAG: hypothetical protein KatS3mg081_2083 [Gemmatimonadales bacterium]